MPVKFKGASEYTDNYPQFQSYKSASFQPSPEQAARTAGLETTNTALVFEPPLQRKKRVGGPQVSLSADYYDAGEGQNEYALLGQQEKFANNVRYRPKSGFINSRSAPPPKQIKLDEQKAEKKVEKKKPAPVVDTSKFTEPPTPPTPLAPRKPKDETTQTQKTKSIQAQPRDKAVQNGGVKQVKDGPVSVLKSTGVQADVDPPVKQGLKDKNLSDVLGEMKKKKPNMNEFAQTDVEKGVIDSAPEAPAEYAMKYKAGVAPPRPPRKQSVYQREFDWKKGVPASPMLAAEQVVYNSKVCPVKTSGFPKTTEYKAQFKKWKAIENDPVPAVKHAMKQQAALKNKAMKRSKSLGAADRREVDKKSMVEDGTRAEVRKPLAHHGKLRKMTEYAANFKPPQKFNYEKGAWKGADPPHLYAQKPEPKTEEEKPALSNWFAEVVELRRKAAEYKKRAQGTHFSREHLVQLMAKQAGVWDVPASCSGSSSTLSALSLEAGNSKFIQQPSKKTKNGKKDTVKSLIDFDSCHATISDLSEVPTDLDEDVSVAPQPVPQQVPRTAPKKVKNYNRKMAWLEEHQKENMEPVQERIDDDIIDDKIVQEGRLPTPLLRQSKMPKKTRHHLDRTTPAVGGAILTSPPPVRKRSYGSGSSPISEEEESERREFGKTYNMNRLRTTPTFGHPSEDTHILRDEEASVDRPLKPRYLYTPVEQVEDFEEETQEPVPEPPVRRQSRKKERMRPAGIPSTLREEMADTYNKPILNLPAEEDDDDMSLYLSVRSIASSSSLASEVYERSKNRRDNFW